MKMDKKHNILKQKRHIEKRIIQDTTNKINNKTTKIEITNMNHNFNRKIVVSLSLILVIVFIVTVSSSYAFFTTSIKGKEFVIYTGNLAVNYEKKTNVINVDNSYPMTDTEGLTTTSHEFMVTNNGSIDARYQIRLELDESLKDMVDIRYIKIAYQVNGGDYSTPVLLSDLNSSLVFIKDVIVTPTESNTYGIKLWIDLSAPNDIQGKTFKARIVVDSIQNVDDGYVVDTTPIIYLNKDINDNQDIYLKTNDTYTELGVEKVEDDQEIFTPSQVNLSYEYYDGTNLSTVQSIDTSKNGIYYITYSITDKSGNTGKRVRVVTINPTDTIPTITLNGDEEIIIPSDVYYTDPGVIVDDNNSVIKLGEVKTSASGNYIVRYIVVDQNGNLNSVTRTVNVNSDLEKVFTFDYVEDENGNGYEQEFVVPYDGQYQIETWGAQGGDANNLIGGYGAFSVGQIYLNKDNKMYINVGGQGLSSHEPNTSISGGYNGGGQGYTSYGNFRYSGSGGGATHISFDSGLLSSLENKKENIVIVSGGGAGVWYYASDAKSYIVGHAGGIIGNSGFSYIGWFDPQYYESGGGTQIGSSSINGVDHPVFGSFGQGANSGEGEVPGAGGGLYGGNGSSFTAGGGSSYIGNSKLINKSMYCYECQESSEESTKTISTTGSNADTTNCPDGYSASPISKCAKAGNGYAKITYLGY